MSNTPKPLIEAQKTRLRILLPRVVKKFVNDAENHVSDHKTFFEIWFEVPNMTGKYASMGFTPDLEPLYWTIPSVQPEKLDAYKRRGYGDDYKGYLWKYVAIPEEFWERPQAEQESWLGTCVEGLLSQDESLRGM